MCLVNIVEVLVFDDDEHVNRAVFAFESKIQYEGYEFILFCVTYSHERSFC